MIINSIEVKGKDKDTAVVELQKGLNVIAGASSTGKSYIVECLQFVFGAKSVPKSIKESKGYTSVEVTFKKDNGHTFILSRDLIKGADITCTEVEDGNLKTILKPNHKGKNNLSDFILTKIGLEGRVLAKGLINLNHLSLTLRVLEKIFLVDEKRIISSSSPLGTGQYGEKTQELSFLRSLITGLDDAEIKNLKSRRQSKVSLANEIHKLEDFLERFLPIGSENLESLDGVLAELESSYEKIEEELIELISSNKSLLDKRGHAAKKIEKLRKEKMDNEVLVFRFRQLKEKYNSDKERLTANSESASYLNKQEELDCPVCGAEIHEESDFNIEQIIVSSIAEVAKIDIKIEDLSGVIDEIIFENNNIDKNSLSLTNEVHEIDLKLNSEITEKLKINNKILHDIGVERANYRIKKEEAKRRDGVTLEIGNLKVEHDAITDEYQIPSFDSEAKALAEKISSILTRWDFPDQRNVSFDIESRDVVIGGTPRGHFGKGMRAICFSAFMIGLMQKIGELGNHPGFIILDSPLTSYKEGDVLDDGDERVADLTYAFYRDLCDNYKDSQIIILDNKEPEVSLHSKMKYIHFSRNKQIGRYGFFPINSN